MRLATGIALACLGLAACGQKPADPRGVDRDEVLVQVAASGRSDTRPDEARFTAGVQTLARTAEAASTENAETMNRVTAALEEIGVSPDDMQTRQISLERIEYGPQRGQYRATNTLEVRMRDVDRASQAIAATTEAGANVLSGPNLTIADPEAARQTAYVQAYKSARARADAYAQAAGLKVTRVLTIRDVGGGQEPIPLYGPREAMAEQAAPAPPVRPGTTTSEVQVRVDFALAPD